MIRIAEEKILTRLADIIVAAILTTSITEAICLFRGLEGSLPLALAVSLVLCSLLSCFLVRWWLAPAVLLPASLVALLLLWRFDLIAAAGQKMAEFFLWSYSWLRFGQPDAPSPGWPTWLRLLLQLPIALPLQQMIRKVTWFPAYVILSAVVFTPLLIWYPDALPILLLAISGLIIQMPRCFVRLVKKERPLEPELPRATLQFLAIPLAVICLLLAQAVIPASTRHWRMPALVNQLRDWRDLWQNNVGESRSWKLFDLSAYGFQPIGIRLGGPVHTSETVVLEVRTDNPVLLRGSSSDLYTGDSWRRSTSRYYRFASNLWWQLRRQAFDAGLPSGAAGRSFLQQYSRPATLEIRSYASQSTLFAAGRVKRIQSDNTLDFTPYFTENGNLFIYGGAPERFAYTLETECLDRSQAGFDQALLAIEAAAAQSTDYNWGKIGQMYLQLPEQLPPEVSAAALAAVDPDSSPYQQALDLLSFFQTGFTYSLEPEMPPENVDFVANFLQARTGYCVYYATAMAVMARTLGIPSRYVEGFLLHQRGSRPSDPQLWLATANSAHAWTELYFRGIGWITFDPTPAGSLIEPVPTGEPERPTPSPVPSGSAPTPAATGEDPGEPADHSSRIWLELLYFLLILALLSRLLIAWLRRRHNKIFQPEIIRRRLPDPANRLDFYYHDLLLQLACLDIRPERGETLASFAERADRYLRLDKLPLPEILWPVSRWRYGGQPPDEADLEKIASLHQRLEIRLQENMNRLAYFIRRIMT